MADEITLTGTFEDIADAIREKGISGTMKATDMPGKIRQIAQIDPEDYYTKSETSSAAELSDAFASIPADVATQGYVQEQISDFVTESDVQNMGFQTLDDITAMGFTTESDVTAIVDSSTSDFVDAQQVADQIALNEDGFVQGKVEGEATSAPRAAVALDDTSMRYIIDQGMLDPETIYFPGPRDEDVGGVKPFVAASRPWVDDQGYLKSGDLTAYYDKTETSSAAEISAADEGVRSYASDAINYISSEVSADVDSTNVKHISACYLTDYVELSTSGTPDPDTLYFCVG